jgi:WD40 repeat protein
MRPARYTYKAFLSYSHAADGRLAPALQSALHRFAKPWYRLRAVRVFRDRTNLSANPGLWPEIQKALGESEFLLLMASPASADSKWVRLELKYWLENRDPARLILLLTDGELSWDETAGDFAWPRTTALADLVRGQFKQEPRYVDLKFAKGVDQLSTRHPQFLDGVATIAAALHGRPKDEIFGEDVRQHRRTKQLAWSAGTVLLLLLIATVVAAIGFYWQYTVAEKRRQETEERERIANIRRLSAEAGRAESQSPQRALLLAGEALRVSLDRNTPCLPVARQAMLHTLARVGGVALYRHAGPVKSLAVSGDGQWLASGDVGGALALTRLTPARAAPVSWKGHGEGIPCLAFTPDGLRLASGSYDGTLKVWNLADPAASLVEFGKHAGGVSAVLVTQDGTKLVTAGFDGVAKVWDARELRTAPRELRGHADWIRGATMTADGRKLATISKDGTARVWDLANPAAKPQVLSHFDNELCCGGLSQDGRFLVTASGHSKVWVWCLETAAPSSRTLTKHSRGVSGLAFAPGGRSFVTVGRDRMGYVWSLDAPTGEPTPLRGHEGEVAAAAFHPHQAERLVTAGGPVTRPVFLVDGVTLQEFGKDQTIRAWDWSSPRNVDSPTVLYGHEGDVNHLVFAPDGRKLFSGGEDGIVREWDFEEEVAPAATLAGGPPSLRDSEPSLRAGPALPVVRRAHVRTPFSIRALTYGETDDVAVTVGKDGLVLAWDLKGSGPARVVADRRAANLQDRRVDYAAVTPDARWVITANRRGEIEKWPLGETAGTPETLCQMKGDSLEGSFSRNARAFLERCNGGTVLVHYPEDRARPVRCFSGGHPIVSMACLNAAGTHLAAVFSDQESRKCEICVWDLSAELPPKVIRHEGPAPNAVAVGASGRHLAVTDAEGGVWLRDLDDLAKPPVALLGHVGWVTEIDFSSDGKWLATAGGKDDRTVRIWNVEDLAEEPVQLPSVEGLITHVALSPTGDRLVIADQYGFIRVWPLSPHELMRIARGTAGRPLSTAEWQRFFPGSASRDTFAEFLLPEAGRRFGSHEAIAQSRR